MIGTEHDAAKWRRQIESQCDDEGKSALALLEAYYDAHLVLAKAVHKDEGRGNGMLELAGMMEQRLREQKDVKFGDIARSLTMLLRHAAQDEVEQQTLAAAIQPLRGYDPGMLRYVAGRLKGLDGRKGHVGTAIAETLKRIAELLEGGGEE